LLKVYQVVKTRLLPSSKLQKSSFYYLVYYNADQYYSILVNANEV